MKFALVETKLGWVALGIQDGAIVAAQLPASRRDAERALQGWGATEPADGREVVPLIDLARRAAEGEDVRVNGHVRLVSGTSFQRAVWRELFSIPRGATATYGEIAERVGRPGAARAVGRAVGSNPVPLLVPCHRVVASTGLGGFGGGLPLKRTLLRQEGVAV